MNVISTIQEFRTWRKNILGSIGFVPTMGALHEGHFSLVAESNKTCKNIVVSIYLNPTQFAQGEDLDTYPNRLQDDLNRLSEYKVDCVLTPNNSQMYPEGFKTNNYSNNLFTLLEGKSRSDFFKGVTTIVAKLFDIVEPTHTFFGEKDFQQLCIINKMVKDLNYPVQVVPCPIIRKKNGLAMSSRNTYLTESEHLVSSTIFKALDSAKKLLKDGKITAKKLRCEITQIINSETAIRIDYVSVANSDTLEEVEGELKGGILVSIAVFLGRTRLIDNFTYSLPELHI